VFWQSADWLNRLKHDRESVEREFENTYGYPLPWCEVATLEEVESLAWNLSKKIGIEPPTIQVGVVLDRLWQRMSAGKSSERGDFLGHPERDFEAIDSAVARLDVPSDGRVVLLTNWNSPRDQDRQQALRMRMKSVIDSVFWNEDTFVIEENAQWALVSMHTWPAFFWRA